MKRLYVDGLKLRSGIILFIVSCLLWYGAKAFGEQSGAQSGVSTTPNAAKLSADDKMISATLKALVHMYIAAQDKKDLATRIETMDPKVFEWRFASAYRLIEQAPQVEQKFDLMPYMSRQEVAQRINSWDKKQLYDLIESIPDAAIAGEFKKYLARRSQEVRSSNIVTQVTSAWGKLVGSLGQK